MKRLKNIIREGVWETNSSSTHSIVIYNTDLVKREDEDCTLEIKDNILYVHTGMDFGWQFFKTNDCNVKLQYVCGLMCRDYCSGSGHKIVKKLKNTLKDYLGVDSVVFDWDEFKKIEDEDAAVLNLPKEDIYYRNIPSIDHQSVSENLDIVGESRGSIIDFIFSRKSWLFGGNDNGECDVLEFYKEISTPLEPVMIGSIEFGGKVGRVDIEIFTYNSYDMFEDIRKDDRIRCSFFNLETGEIEICNDAIDYAFRDDKYLPFSEVCREGTELFLKYRNLTFNMRVNMRDGKEEDFSIQVPIKIISEEFGVLC